MKPISIPDAFAAAPPRSACVLCVRGDNGTTELILTEWFSWLNIKRNPMLSFSLPRGIDFGKNLREGDSFVLAFPPTETALKYKQGIRVSADNKLPVVAEALPFPVPGGSEIALSCTLAGAYNYPFKKVRIFNCNLEEALGNLESMLD